MMEQVRLDTRFYRLLEVALDLFLTLGVLAIVDLWYFVYLKQC